MIPFASRRRSPRKPPQMLLLLVWLFLFHTSSMVVSAQVQKSCPPSCEPEGECVPCQDVPGENCVGNVCRCKDGFGGDDCSLIVQECPPSMAEQSLPECYNGGDCVVREIFADELGLGQSEQVWRCDCTTAMGNAKTGPQSHEGPQCEYPATQSCMLGGSLSAYAFCVNGGDCVRKITSKEGHPGCICTDAYEGRHCQYEKGNAPPEELQIARTNVLSNDNGMKPGMITFLVILTLVLLSAFGYFVWKHRGFSSTGGGITKQEILEATSTPVDLALEEVDINSPSSSSLPADNGDPDENVPPNEEERPQVV